MYKKPSLKCIRISLIHETKARFYFHLLFCPNNKNHKKKTESFELYNFQINYHHARKNYNCFYKQG